MCAQTCGDERREVNRGSDQDAHNSVRKLRTPLDVLDPRLEAIDLGCATSSASNHVWMHIALQTDNKERKKT